MLGNFFKNTGIKIASGDLDNCIYYLSNQVPSHIRVESASAMWREIENWLPRVIGDNLDAGLVSAKFTQLKNDIMLNRGLKNHRDSDFCIAYLLSCFFAFIKTADLQESKDRIVRLLRFIEKNFDSQLAADDRAKAGIRALIAGFES